VAQILDDPDRLADHSPRLPSDLLCAGQTQAHLVDFGTRTPPRLVQFCSSVIVRLVGVPHQAQGPRVGALGTGMEACPVTATNHP
jgi:hypothetical protein